LRGTEERYYSTSNATLKLEGINFEEIMDIALTQAMKRVKHILREMACCHWVMPRTRSFSLTNAPSTGERFKIESLRNSVTFIGKGGAMDRSITDKSGAVTSTLMNDGTVRLCG